MNQRNLPDWIARGLWMAAVVAFASLWVGPKPASAQEWPSGETLVPAGAAEAAINGQTGRLVFQMLPAKSASPANANETAQTPLYFVFYPLNSAVPANNLNCQPSNCDHLNVLPFADDDYGALSAGSTACTDFNGGQACSEVEGHDHLRGGVPPAGASTSNWIAYLVVFTSKGFSDGAINHRITTLGQLDSLETSEDVEVLPTGLTVPLTPASQQLYQSGTPYQVTYP